MGPRVDEAAAEVAATSSQSGSPPPFRLELELPDGDALDRVGAGAPNALGVHAEHGHLDGQEPERVARDEGDPARVADPR